MSRRASAHKHDAVLETLDDTLRATLRDLASEARRRAGYWLARSGETSASPIEPFRTAPRRAEARVQAERYLAAAGWIEERIRVR